MKIKLDFERAVQHFIEWRLKLKPGPKGEISEINKEIKYLAKAGQKYKKKKI